MAQGRCVDEIRAVGLEAVALATTLLQRARRTDPVAGTWEAADLHWWWRRPRASDDVEQVFWLDAEGPVAAVVTTAWNDTWQCDQLHVPGATPGVEVVWDRAHALLTERAVGRVEVPVREDAAELRTLVEAAGLVVGETDSVAWIDVADRPAVRPLPDGFVLVDRVQRAGTPHHMRERNGEEVGDRLAVSTLYDPALDLAVETTDGRLAGYVLFWFDPVTRCGLVEPVRVEDEFQRRGLATTILTHGLDRLANRGAERVKIGFGTEAAGAVYTGVGFVPTSRDVWYVGRFDG